MVSLSFEDKYTTAEKITRDTTGTENKKTILSNDSFAIGKQIEELMNEFKLGRMK